VLPADIVDVAVGDVDEVDAAIPFLQGYRIGIPSTVPPTSEEHSNRLLTHQNREGRTDTAAHPDILHARRASIPRSDESRYVMLVLVSKYRIGCSKAKAVPA
jgi:hypothetical protein